MGDIFTPENIKIILISVAIFSILGGILGIIIGIFFKFFKVEEDKRVETVLSYLPGANCGGCGFPGCAGMADAIVNKGINPRQCKPIKQEKIDEIKLYLDEYNRIKVENEILEKKN